MVGPLVSGSARRVDRFLEDLSSSFHSFSSRLLIFADKRTPFQELSSPSLPPRNNTDRTRSPNSGRKLLPTTVPLFPRNVRTCRIMARGEKTKEPSCWASGEHHRALLFLSTLSPTFSPTLDFAVLVQGYFLGKGKLRQVKKVLLKLIQKSIRIYKSIHRS